MQNQIDYKNGAQLIANENVESQLIFGKGRSYGVEVFVKKKVGRMTGWISYTLSRTERRFEGVNNYSWYPANQDRTHNLAVVGIYRINPKWTLSGDFVYYTGNAVTWPSGKYEVNGQIVFLVHRTQRLPDAAIQPAGPKRYATGKEDEEIRKQLELLDL